MIVIERLLRLGRAAGKRERRREQQIGKGIDVLRPAAEHPINGRLVLLLHEERPFLVVIENPERWIAGTEADGLVHELKREIRPPETAVGQATDKICADVVVAQGEGAFCLAEGLLVTITPVSTQDLAKCAMPLSASRTSAREMSSSAFSRSASRSTLCAVMTDTAMKNANALSAKTSCPSACSERSH